MNHCDVSIKPCVNICTSLMVKHASLDSILIVFICHSIWLLDTYQVSKMNSDFNNLDTALVMSFFTFFVLLTFYYIGIQMHFIKEVVDKVKRVLGTLKKPKTQIQVVQPELISAKYNRLSDFLTGRGKLQSFDSSISLFLSNVTPVILIGKY